MSMGLILAIAGAALAAALGGIGSAYGVRLGGQAAAGVVSENPDLFGKLLVLQALPGTQGIYGFLTAVLVIVRVGLLGGGSVDLTLEQGLAFFVRRPGLILSAGIRSATLRKGGNYFDLLQNFADSRQQIPNMGNTVALARNVCEIYFLAHSTINAFEQLNGIGI